MPILRASSPILFFSVLSSFFFLFVLFLYPICRFAFCHLVFFFCFVNWFRLIDLAYDSPICGVFEQVPILNRIESNCKCALMRDAPISYTKRLIIFFNDFSIVSRILLLHVIFVAFRQIFNIHTDTTHTKRCPINRCNANKSIVTIENIEKMLFAVSKSISYFWSIYLFHYVWCESVIAKEKKKDRLRIRSNQSIVSAASQINFNVRLFLPEIVQISLLMNK